MDRSTPLGPKTKMLLVEIAASLVMKKSGEPNSEDGFGKTALVADRIQKHLKADMAEAFDALCTAHSLLRAAPDADPNWTDEEISERFLKAIERRRKALIGQEPV